MKRPPLYTFLERIGFRPWARTVYRISIEGAERVPKTGPVLLISNHESLIDPWFLALVTPRPVRYMAKAELFGIAPLRWIMNAFGTFPVERGTGDLTAFTRGEQLLRDGHVLGVFPQGTCLPYRERPWHRGAAKLALRTGAVVIPVAIIGSERALRPAKFKLGLPKIRLIVGEPIEVPVAKPTIAGAKELTRTFEHAVEALREPFGAPAHAWYPDERKVA
jgi:1-acyl-sn-glycerol-3-phosphate acyltransferase